MMEIQYSVSVSMFIFRLKKEYEAYQKEAQKQTEKITKMKSEEEDAYSIKKQVILEKDQSSNMCSFGP